MMLRSEEDPEDKWNQEKEMRYYDDGIIRDESKLSIFSRSPSRSPNKARVCLDNGSNRKSNGGSSPSSKPRRDLMKPGSENSFYRNFLKRNFLKGSQ